MRCTGMSCFHGFLAYRAFVASDSKAKRCDHSNSPRLNNAAATLRHTQCFLLHSQDSAEPNNIAGCLYSLCVLFFNDFFFFRGNHNVVRRTKSCFIGYDRFIALLTNLMCARTGKVALIGHALAGILALFAVMGRLRRKTSTRTFMERTSCRQYFFLGRGFSAKPRGSVLICMRTAEAENAAPVPPSPGVYEEVSAGAATETLFVEAAARGTSRERRRRFSWTERGTSVGLYDAL